MPPQATIWRLCLALGLLCYVLAHPLHQDSNAGLRGLGGLLGDEGDVPLPASDPETENKALPKHPHLTFTSEGLGGLLTAELNPSRASSVQATVSSASRTASTLNSGAALTQFSTTTSHSFTSFPSPTTTIGATKEAPSTPPAEATEWKVIGIAALGIGVVAAVMLAIVFFDSWWGFVLALVGKRKKDRGREDMVPDWAGRDWEFKIASEDGHRYPTLASLESMTKPKQDLTGTTPLMSPSPDTRHLPPVRPPSLYLPVVDPHPLEPLFRRPSASNGPIRHDPMFRP
ncbi:hypothetical protein B0H19DRAFT_1128566 [Mycena capillaripes]|nr:hypothetical protein B0H19DRAFT_1128566 [Mycena capillaripes]